MRPLKVIAGLVGALSAIMFLIYAIMAFGGPDNLDDVKTMSGLNGLGYTFLAAALGLFFVDSGL